MKEKQIMIKEDVVAMTVEILLNALTALDLCTARLKNEVQTIDAIHELLEELKIIWTQECRRKMQAEDKRKQYILLRSEPTISDLRPQDAPAAAPPAGTQNKNPQKQLYKT